MRSRSHGLAPEPDNASLRATLISRRTDAAPPWHRWRLGTPRVRWPVFALQWAIFFSTFGISSGGSYGGEGSLLRQVSWVMLFVLAVLGVTASPAHFKHVLAVVRGWRLHLAALVVFCLFAAASTAWAEFPAVTAKRAALLGLVVCLCILAAATTVALDLSLAAVLVPPMLALLLISLAFTAAFPSVAFSPIGWQGMTGHKNIAGQLTAILALSALLLRGGGWLGRPWVRWGVIVMAVVGLGLSRSATALVCLLAALAALGLIGLPAMLRRHTSWAVAALVLGGALLLVAWLLFLFDAMPSAATLSKLGLSALGKSDTFTGRTKLWDLVMAQDQYRSAWLGLGFGGFWDSSYGQILYVIQRLGFRPIQAHNGYLDLYNEVGLVGLALALLVVLVALYGVAKALMRHTDRRDTALAAALLVFVLVSNLAESSLMRTTNLLNLLFLLVMLVGGAKPAVAAGGAAGKPWRA